LATPWGEGAIFFAFFLVLVIVFPAVMVRLWGCTPLPAGPARQSIEALCAAKRLGYREIMSWPLFGGRMLTAAVLGVAARFRYLLVTPSLLEAMTAQELEAVMAHEIGHVKRFHLQLYLFLFLGFGIMAQLSAYPLTMVLLNSNLFYQALLFLNTGPAKFIPLFSVVPLIILMLLYFRFFFGFFMRNFERQADVYSCRAMRDISPMVRVLEKIAWLSGNSRDLPSWHHFSIGQRIDFLKKCRLRPGVARRHDLKVYASLVLYVMLLCAGGLMLWRLPEDLLQGAPREKFAMAILEQKVRAEPQNYLWQQFLGDLHAQGQREAEAFVHYEKALALAPGNGELLNNFAWLLITSEVRAVRNPSRGLALARKAAAVQEQGYVLDTLGMALWVNGFTEQAVAAEMRAMALDPAGREYYRQQMARFLAAPRPEAAETPRRRRVDQL
jgi:Zn-dependent protease with chaperone function